MSRAITNTPKGWNERATIKEPWEASGWSREGQAVRFHSVRHYLPLLDGQSLLDFGCGTGMFAEGLPEGIEYHGVDWSPAMLKRARKDHPNGTFTDVLPDRRFDHVIAVGAFNLAQGWSVIQTRGIIGELWACCQHTLIVSLYRGDDPTCISYWPEEVAAWGALLSKRFLIDANYLDNDLLLVVRR